MHGPGHEKACGATRQGRPCAGSARTARAGPAAPACGRFCRGIGRAVGPLAACPAHGAGATCPSRRVQPGSPPSGARRLPHRGLGAACLRTAEPAAPRMRVPDPRRPARAARDRACQRPSFSRPRARAPRASAPRAARESAASSPRRRACAPAACANPLHPHGRPPRHRRNTSRICATRHPRHHFLLLPPPRRRAGGPAAT